MVRAVLPTNVVYRDAELRLPLDKAAEGRHKQISRWQWQRQTVVSSLFHDVSALSDSHSSFGELRTHTAP